MILGAPFGASTGLVRSYCLHGVTAGGSQQPLLIDSVDTHDSLASQCNNSIHAVAAIVGDADTRNDRRIS